MGIPKKRREAGGLGRGAVEAGPPPGIGAAAIGGADGR